jgi:hypothetical protein
MKSCIFCQKLFKQGRNCFGIYCSNACQGAHTAAKVVQTFLDNPSPETFYHKGQQIRKSIRDYFLKLADCKCQLCGWGLKHPSAVLPPLEVDHKDGNWQNCSLDNFQVVCPNCHALTDSYKARNKGNGRAYRRETTTNELPQED